MSYLHPLRLHFAGRFRADVSTVNNDVIHYNNPTFDLCFNKQGPGATLGWWNPAGTGNWRIAECRVRRVCYADGTFSEDPARDAALSADVTDAADRPSAKLVDLDPQQQMVSQIFGLQLRLRERASGALLLKAEFRVAPFQQIWMGRLSEGQGDSGGSAAYQSILHDLAWGDLARSPVLQALQRAAPDGRLSIKFNLDHYAMGGPDKTYGRIVGTIGPCEPGEPEQLVLGRHLVPNGTDRYPMHHSVCVVDPQRRKILADFGNALPTQGDGMRDLGDVVLGVATDQGIVPIGPSSYRDPDWYLKTAGVEEFPRDGALSDELLDAVGRFPLAVFTPADGGSPTVLSPESPDGLYLRPDGNVFRLNPGEPAEVRIFLTRRGRPVADAEVDCALYTGGLDGDGAPIGRPAAAVGLAASVRTDANGVATLKIAAGDPGTPRRFIAGQIYGIGYQVAAAAEQKIRTGTGLEGDNFISLLLFGGGTAPAEVTWEDVRPILQQYANLYPRPHGPRNYVGRDSIHSLFDLGRYEDVVRYRDYIIRALARPIEDPGAMPVTRDLAAWKRDMIIAWLATPGRDGLPKRSRETALEAPPPTPEAVPELGGKTAAALRTPALRAAVPPRRFDP